MYSHSLQGIFPVPKKESKKNFIKENVRLLRQMQTNREKNGGPINIKPKLVVSSVSNENMFKTQNSNQHVAKSQNTRNHCSKLVPKPSNTLVSKPEMNDFHRKNKPKDPKIIPQGQEYFKKSTDKLISCRDVGCQYVDPELSIFFKDGSNPRVIYPSQRILDSISPKEDLLEERDVEDPRLIINSKEMESRYLSHEDLERITENVLPSEVDFLSPVKLDSNITTANEGKHNPFLPPPSYQKGVVPKYIKEIKQRNDQKREQEALQKVDHQCPPGHVALPETERLETLQILRGKFSEFVRELNRMPVRSDTLRMRNRKMQLDKELQKLEDGIKVFSRPKVYVNIQV